MLQPRAGSPGQMHGQEAGLLIGQCFPARSAEQPKSPAALTENGFPAQQHCAEVEHHLPLGAPPATSWPYTPSMRLTPWHSQTTTQEARQLMTRPRQSSGDTGHQSSKKQCLSHHPPGHLGASHTHITTDDIPQGNPPATPPMHATARPKSKPRPAPKD
ncbi:hypothetical protein KIL84_000094 [Mauremys mutica]|uniref:Uncharacterized protein n=1 Tax=Mauremys mutica TaxID=74926 RepID=A0A9D3XG63_9SAUR|nr:hypothetical protein KIL84_000094 [Mauremys mutica]